MASCLVTVASGAAIVPPILTAKGEVAAWVAARIVDSRSIGVASASSRVVAILLLAYCCSVIGAVASLHITATSRLAAGVEAAAAIVSMGFVSLVQVDSTSAAVPAVAR